MDYFRKRCGSEIKLRMMSKKISYFWDFENVLEFRIKSHEGIVFVSSQLVEGFRSH